MVRFLNSVRQSLGATPSESLLYRTASCLYLELNDPASAEQLLVEANKRDVLDDAGRLLLAEIRKSANDLPGCKEISDVLIADGWLANGRTTRLNLVRVAHVSWLVSVWLGEPLQVAAKTKDWEAANELRATMGCIHATALRRLIEKKCENQQLNAYCQEMVRCVGTLLSTEGYLGFLAKEAMECLKQILIYHQKDTLNTDTRTALVEFFDRHFSQICSVHREVSLGDQLTKQLLEILDGLNTQSDKGPQATERWEPLKDDARLAEFGYVTVEIYQWPVDSLGNRRSFCFARGTESTEYYVSRRALSDATDFYGLSIGDRLSVRPKTDYDEGKAIPVTDAMKY
jgi:hypothetical protein